MEYQEIDFSEILSSLSDNNITVICDVIRRPVTKWVRGCQTVNNLKLTVFMFKAIECCSKTYNIGHVGSRSVLKYQHHWEVEQNKVDNFKDLSKDHGSHCAPPQTSKGGAGCPTGLCDQIVHQGDAYLT